MSEENNRCIRNYIEKDGKIVLKDGSKSGTEVIDAYKFFSVTEKDGVAISFEKKNDILKMIIVVPNRKLIITETNNDSFSQEELRKICTNLYEEYRIEPEATYLASVRDKSKELGKIRSIAALNNMQYIYEKEVDDNLFGANIDLFSFMKIANDYFRMTKSSVKRQNITFIDPGSSAEEDVERLKNNLQNMTYDTTFFKSNSKYITVFRHVNNETKLSELSYNEHLKFFDCIVGTKTDNNVVEEKVSKNNKNIFIQNEKNDDEYKVDKDKRTTDIEKINFAYLVDCQKNDALLDEDITNMQSFRSAAKILTNNLNMMNNNNFLRALRYFCNPRNKHFKERDIEEYNMLLQKIANAMKKNPSCEEIQEDFETLVELSRPKEIQSMIETNQAISILDNKCEEPFDYSQEKYIPLKGAKERYLASKSNRDNAFAYQQEKIAQQKNNKKAKNKRETVKKIKLAIEVGLVIAGSVYVGDKISKFINEKLIDNNKSYSHDEQNEENQEIKVKDENGISYIVYDKELNQNYSNKSKTQNNYYER